MLRNQLSPLNRMAEPEKAYIWTSEDNLTEMTVDMDRAYEVSYLASRQQDEVAMTPYMKNALIKYDHYTDNKRLMVDDPITAAEKYIQRITAQELKDLYGKEVLSYNRELDALDVQHYYVDNFRNFKTGISMRDIQPGQDVQREQGFETFRSNAPDTPEIFYDNYVGNALVSVLNDMPRSIKASSEFKDWSGPFERKHTQVSWPFFYRDDVIVNAENDYTGGELSQYYGLTYGQMCVEIAKHTEIGCTLDYTVNMGYGRNQRGKGRPLIAMARIPAIVYNRMTQPETEACKVKCPFMVGYNDRAVLKNAMMKQAEIVVDNNWCMENFDYHAFDQSISPQWLGLGAYVWYNCAADNTSKEIVKYRAAYGLRGLLVDGLSKSAEPIYGRMFSGFIETNKTENVINATASTAALIKQDRDWINKIHRRSPYSRIYMGDDCLITYDRNCFNHDQYVKDIANYGFEVHPDKGEFGAFFLQNRLFRDGQGYTFTYPWTRVLRSVLFKEASRGLGPAGWTLATYSQLANIREYKEGLAFVRDVILEFDDYKLMLDEPISSIIQQVQEEDEKAIAANKRAMTTYDIINDGDPGKYHFDGKESRYLKALQNDIRPRSAQHEW